MSLVEQLIIIIFENNIKLFDDENFVINILTLYPYSKKKTRKTYLYSTLGRDGYWTQIEPVRNWPE